jgi:hypothetical protein
MADVKLINPQTGEVKYKNPKDDNFDEWASKGFQPDMNDPATVNVIKNGDPVVVGNLQRSFPDVASYQRESEIAKAKDFMKEMGLSGDVESFLKNGQLPENLQSTFFNDPMFGQSEQSLGQFGDVLQTLKDQAWDTNASPFEQARMEQQQFEEQGARDQLTGQLAGQQGTAFSRLASQGGLSSGARERLAQSGARAGFQGQQGLTRQGIGERLGIRAEELGKKQDLQTMLPEMFGSLASGQLGLGQTRSQGMYNAQQSNIMNIINEMNKKRDLEEQRKLLGAKTAAGFITNPENSIY